VPNFTLSPSPCRPRRTNLKVTHQGFLEGILSAAGGTVNSQAVVFMRPAANREPPPGAEALQGTSFPVYRPERYLRRRKRKRPRPPSPLNTPSWKNTGSGMGTIVRTS